MGVVQCVGGAGDEGLGGQVAGKGGEPVGFADGVEHAGDDDQGEVDEREDRGGGFDGGDRGGEGGGRSGPRGGAEHEDGEYAEG